MLEPEEEARITRLEADSLKHSMELQHFKEHFDSELGNSTRHQNRQDKDIEDIKDMLQGKGHEPGVLENQRNLSRQIKIFGVVLCTYTAGTDLGILQALLKFLTG